MTGNMTSLLSATKQRNSHSIGEGKPQEKTADRKSPLTVLIISDSTRFSYCAYQAYGITLN